MRIGDIDTGDPVTFSNSNGVSFGTNVDVITASVATSLTAVNISAGTTSNNLSAVTFSNSNNVSFGLNGSTITASASVASTQGSINISAGTTSNLASAFTFSNSNGVSFGLNASTVTASVATSLTNINISAGTTSNNLSAVTFSNSNGVSFGLNASTVTASVATSLTNINVSAGTTSNNLSAITFSNSNNITFGLNASTVTASYAFNISAGTTSNALSAVTFSNSNGVSFGLNASTVTASVATSLTNINVSAGTTSNNLSAITFSNSNGIFFGLNGSTLTAAESTLSYYRNTPIFVNTQSLTVQGSTFYVFPFMMSANHSISYLRFPISASAQSTSYGTSGANTAYSASLLSTIFAVVYSLGTGASSRSLQSVASGSSGVSQQWSISQSSTQYTVSFRVTVPSEGGSNTLSTSQGVSSSTINLNTGSLTNFTGFRYLDINFVTSLPPGAYWMAFGISSTTSTQGTNAATGLQISISNVVVSQINNPINQFGGATNSSNAYPLGVGSFTTNVINTTASIALSNISSSASQNIFCFEAIRQV
jgi:hypothetical protein